MGNLKRNDTNEFIYKQKDRDLENKLMVAEGKRQGVWAGHEHMAVFKMDNQQGPTVQHMEICPTLCGSLNGMGGLGENGYMYGWWFSP